MLPIKTRFLDIHSINLKEVNLFLRFFEVLKEMGEGKFKNFNKKICSIHVPDMFQFICINVRVKNSCNKKKRK